jgi:O-acetyl-ADP-ribose deacetylase (regulator of RNase III)
MEVKIGKTKLALVIGDITDQDTDAVVAAANPELERGSGTNGAIHARGGPRIYEECRVIGGCAVGDAVITSGGNLKARHVIHAVGPIWRDGHEEEPKLLADAYRRSLEVAMQHRLKSISFPSISTGVYSFPLRLAAPIALETITYFLEHELHGLNEVRMVLYYKDEVAYTVFVSALEQIMLKRTK